MTPDTRHDAEALMAAIGTHSTPEGRAGAQARLQAAEGRRDPAKRTAMQEKFAQLRAAAA